MLALPGAELSFGSEDEHAYPDDGEGPVRRVTVEPLRIGCEAVSNTGFAAFVDASGYVTDAERLGWSFVFAGLLPDDFPATRGVAQAPWWRVVEGATWDHPAGPSSSIDELLDHPVVHVSHNDACRYCEWAGTRLPTEAEWEYAARGGLDGEVYPWGSELEPGGEHRMNVWQGQFPADNTLADGYYATCPVDAFAPNAFGLYNATGNVWEWTADRFSAEFKARDRAHDPLGPPSGTHRVQKGGSYLCHASYCRRYRVAARQANTPDGSAGNLGFRCAAEAVHSGG
ncbi:MAG: SUMF1/EgtB/PvdO family nonheme iron enzyme [Solirubrobacterales bacterium]|nr:SUMF1/EgtB/PvdO family nonheme iron enzyme [Solirubrobacterales bacterium]